MQDGANPTLSCPGSPIRWRWVLFGRSIPLLWRGTWHDTDNRYRGSSLEGLIVYESGAARIKANGRVAGPALRAVDEEAMHLIVLGVQQDRPAVAA